MLKNSNFLFDNVKDFKLVYEAKFEKEFIYVDEFEKLESQSDKFELVRVAAFDENWKGEKGFVTDYMKKLDLKEYKIYMCDPKPMIDASIKVLNSLDVDKKIYIIKVLKELEP